MKINKAKGYPDMLALFLVLAAVLMGCGQNSDTRTPAESTANSITTENVEPAEKETKATDLEVCFGDDGEVYYSEPNRIILFYHDAEIEAEYTKVGYFDYTEGFVVAVENNPVLEGWNTKIVLIQSAD